VSIKNKIEISRNILYNAINMNLSKNTIEKISQKLDKHIVEYYYKNGKHRKQK
jgi:hypothetical protein